MLKRAKKDLRPDELERFKIEFEQTKQLSSPYVVNVYKFDENKHEYTMEYMDSNLADYILKNNNNITLDERVVIAKQVLRGFMYIYKKEVLHRDISPANILVKFYDDVNVVKISDFGLVKLSESDLTNEQTKIKGFFNDHKNLEIVGFNNYNIKHEIYALTKLIYFIMTGRQTLQNYKETIYKDFVDKCINDNLNLRYKSVEELLDGYSKVVERIREHNVK